MKTLYLLRHAKSAWDDGGVADHDRPLAPRGEHAATRIGRYLDERGVRPELILCSTARRASDTLDLVLAEISGGEAGIPVERERGLYLCGPRVLLARIRDVPDSVHTLMLVAHNPDLHHLATSLVIEGEPQARAHLTEKFPTGACAIIAFDAARWHDVAPGTGRLADFVRPRALD
ncbi:histidine phosphatase family protein [Azospirillum sp.]|uniref:SixA phosphatase family protein n=1 Tax=Azospirillum sp. TaxID=34012 RepID=UPI002D54D300|nr:histidine phosphatase family protein [Azospirillum sp.]HYD69385.1 histidine phosphatase family protein [Azospirillum sp.]